MNNIYLANRNLAENYRTDLQNKLTRSVQPEEFAEWARTDPQKFYLEYKNRIVKIVNKETENQKKAVLKSDDSHLLLLKRTALVDAVVDKSFHTAVWLYNLLNQKNLSVHDVPIAIVARGGYGRAETYFLSDVDIHILQSTTITKGPQVSEGIINYFKYLFVYQDIFQSASSSCHSETIELEKEPNPKNLADYFSLMEHRFVTGNQMVYTEFKSAIKTATLLHKKKILEDCYRHKNYYDVENTVFQQEPNVKEELKRLYWALVLVRIHQNLKHLNQFELLYELYEKKILSAPAFKNMQNALNFLAKVRLLLHCHQKGTYRDVLSFEVRDKIAESMGTDLKTFYQNYFYHAGYPLKRYSRNLFLESMGSDTQKVRVLSEFFALNTENQIIFEDGAEKLFSEKPHWIFKVFVWIAEENYHLSYPLIRSIEHHVDQMSPIFMDQEIREEVQHCFLEIMAGKYFSRAIRQLHEFGLLGGYYIPEFQKVCGLLQDIYVHKFPTDMHILSSLDALNTLEFEEGANPFLVDLYRSLKENTTLKLAVLLHDIGKGAKIGDENEELVGARMVPGILENLGYSRTTRLAEDTAFLVEKHLTMYDLMLLDPEEDDTFDMVWDLVDQDKERLKMLVLLTFADRAGTKMKMSPSQIQQLKLFYQYTLHHKRHADVPQSVKLDFLQMVRLPRDLQSQLDVYHEFCQSPERFAADLLFKPDQPAELVVCGKDQKRFLFDVATVLAFNRLQIVEANIQTLEDNVFDVFKVVDLSGSPIEYDNFFFIQKQVNEDLRRIFVDKKSPAAIFKGRNLQSKKFMKHFKEVKLKTKIIGRAILLATHDIFGNFMMEAKVFSQLDMQIQKAVLHTHQETASNIFYVRPEDVEQILENEKRFLSTMKNTLRQLLESESVPLEEPVETG